MSKASSSFVFMVSFVVEWFSNDHLETRSKVITSFTNHGKRRYQDEPINENSYSLCHTLGNTPKLNRVWLCLRTVSVAQVEKPSKAPL